MALTGFFLMIFLLVHLGANLTLFAGNTDSEGNLLAKEEVLFNQASHFMATNPLIQVMQYVLALGFLYHILLGIILTLKNQKARGKERYAVNQLSVNTPFSSRTMIYTGILIFVFILIHLYNYFYPIKKGLVEDDYLLVTELFKSPLYTLIYVVSFILLGLHLSHGFSSSFQSVGFNHRIYTRIIKILGKAYFILIAVGFAAIAIYFYFKGNGLI
jgi:succinate dehydrogenase / fumarate reductase cytochrome b subunit